MWQRVEDLVAVGLFSCIMAALWCMHMIGWPFAWLVGGRPAVQKWKSFFFLD